MSCMQNRYGAFAVTALVLGLQARAAGAQIAEKTPPPPETQTAGYKTAPEGLPEGINTLSKDELIEKYRLPTITPGKPITLREALEAADQRNLSLAAMKADIAVAQGRLKTAWGGVLPVIQGKLGYTVHDHEDTVSFDMPAALGGPSEIVVMQQHDVDGSLEAMMPIVDARAWWSIRVAKEAVVLSRMSVETVRQQLMLNVAEAYFSCLMAEKLIEIQLASLASFDHHRDVAEARFSAGAGLRIDVIRAETDLETARQQLISANLFFDNARDALALLTETEGLPLPVDTGPIPVPGDEPSALAKKALADRADLKVSRAAVALQSNQVKAVYMKFLPFINGTWQGSYQMTDPGEFGSTDRSRMVALFSLTVPLYDHFRYGELDVQRATLRKNEIEQQNAEHRVAQEVRKAHRDYLAALASVETADKQASLSQEALSLTEAAYDAGTGSSLDVTDARRTYLEANVNLARRELEAQTALLKLLFAVGNDMGALGQ